MANKTITDLTAATLPLTWAELLHLVQGGNSRKASIADIVAVTWKKGADIASAAALTLGTDGNYFDITGTATVTSIVSPGAKRVLLQFDGVVTLTHHATNLVLPGGANLATAAGDHAEFIEYATGAWRCVGFQRSSGSLIGSALRYLSVTATTSGAQVDVAVPAWVRRITILLDGVSTDSTGAPFIQLGDSGGLETSGYNGANSIILNGTGASNVNFAGGAIFGSTSAAQIIQGRITVSLLDSVTNTWVFDGIIGFSNGPTTLVLSSSKSLSAPLTTVRIGAGASTNFDAGKLVATLE